MTKALDTNDEAKAFTNLVNLMAVYAEAKSRLAELQNSVDAEFITLIDGHKGEYAELQGIISKTEASLEIAARSHPEWFTDAKSVKVPYGTVSFRSAKKLVVTNEELALVLIKSNRTEEEAAKLIRTREELNLEALEGLSDEELKVLKILRVTEENFSVKEAKVNLGKAVKAADKQAEPKKKAA